MVGPAGGVDARDAGLGEAKLAAVVDDLAGEFL